MAQIRSRIPERAARLARLARRISFIPNWQSWGALFTYLSIDIEERLIDFAALTLHGYVVIDWLRDEAVNTLLPNDSPMRLLVRAGFTSLERLVP